MTALVVWKEDVPAEIKAALQPHLDRWLGHAPTWCHEVIVHWAGEASDGADLRCEPVQEYRWARVTVYGSFLSRSLRDRSESVLHEMLHIALAPSDLVVHSLLDVLKEKVPELHAWANEQFRLAKESAVCDLTRAIAGPLQEESRP